MRTRPFRRLLMCGILLSLLGGSFARASEFERMADRAVKFRGETPIEAQPDGTIIAEAEEFRGPVKEQESKGRWNARNWGENYYAATFANTFLSRKAFLGAAEQVEGAAAEIKVNVPKAGRYLALVRYEAAYRFETQFKLIITQNGQTKLDRLYGARDNVKVWAFKGAANNALQKEVGWYWGAVENVVWEGHDVGVDLDAGVATITLVADKQPEPAAKRNVDLVLLTPNAEDVAKRIATEGYLPLDGLLTQSGDVFFKVTNHAAAGLTLNVNPCTQHSPYWIHIRTWADKPIKVAANTASDWQEVGSLLDTLNDGQWALDAKPESKDGPVSYTLDVGLKSADGKIETIQNFKSQSGPLNLAYDANTRYTRRIRETSDVLYDLLDFIKKNPIKGEPPKRFITYCYSFDPRPNDAKYTAARAEFIKLMGITVNEGMPLTPAGTPAGYIDVRGTATDKLAEELPKQAKEPKSIRTVSLGDEIGLAAPAAGSDEPFRAWAKSRGLKAEEIVPGAGEDWAKVTFNAAPAIKTSSPRQYYYSRLYSFDYGIDNLKQRTEIIRKLLPNADTGANFSPHAGAPYLGESHQWISLFRKGGMTMPWGEDYIWQIPLGSQQMNFLCLDIFRAAVRYQPNATIHYYVMPHWPGNTTASWRRQWYGDLGHGMKVANLFEFRPVQAAYTENHVSLPEMYVEVQKAIHELAKFEDIVLEGRVRPGNAALWWSEAGDVWHNHDAPFGANKRTMYIAAKHAGLQVDAVDEEDAIKGTLKGYKVLFITDRNVSRPATKAIAAWVNDGGKLFATAGAGLRDEFDQTNDLMEALLGVKEKSLDLNPRMPIALEKQDLPFAEAMDEVTARNTMLLFPANVRDRIRVAPITFTTPALGCRSVVAATGGEVVGTFKDNSPAIVRRDVGKGLTTYAAFLPGLSYFRPAIPKRPVDRGSTDNAMSHFIPTEFDSAAATIIGSRLDIEHDIQCSNPLVDAKVVESKNGMFIALSNWSKGKIDDLTVTLTFKVPTKKVELASGGKVKVDKKDGKTVLKLDLDVGDAVILR